MILISQSMNIVQHLFIALIVMYICPVLPVAHNACAKAVSPAISYKEHNKLYLVAKKDKGAVIYRENIIIHSDELETRQETEKSEKFKTVEVSSVDNQKTGLANLEIAYKYLKEGRKYEARNMLSDIFLQKKVPERQKEVKALLDKLNEELIFSQTESPGSIIYTVQPGDVLARIARKYNTTYELIMRINNKYRTMLNIGERLKILTGKTTILIDKSDFTLTLMLDGHYVKQYPVCIGKDDKTPVGTFEVKNKIKEPTWYAPEGGVYPYGHKENILGTRWIGFKDKPGLCGYGIHGTTQPETIGTAASNGCVRMLNTDVEELYDFVTEDTKIIIQG